VGVFIHTFSSRELTFCLHIASSSSHSLPAVLLEASIGSNCSSSSLLGQISLVAGVILFEKREVNNCPSFSPGSASVIQCSS
jgi:hypothetical protein